MTTFTEDVIIFLRLELKFDRGFTLLELLVTVAIVGLLAAIAIPEFKQYRSRAYDSAAISDIHSLYSAEEVYYIDNEDYALCGSTPQCQGVLEAFSPSKNIGHNINSLSFNGNRKMRIRTCHTFSAGRTIIPAGQYSSSGSSSELSKAFERLHSYGNGSTADFAGSSLESGIGKIIPTIVSLNACESFING